MTAGGGVSESVPDPDVQALENELAEVARQIARLLLEPKRDRGALRALDTRAAGLRRRLAAVRPRSSDHEPVDLCHRIGRRGGTPLVSGG